MSQPFGANPKKFGDLLGQFGTPVKVPPFQRGYSWEKTHVSTLCDDIFDFNSSWTAGEQYFLGPIVIIEENDKIVLLDGQQRLATVTVFFAALRDHARALATQKGSDFARDTQRELIEPDDRWSLVLNETDESFFRDAIQSDPPKTVTATLRSHVLIKQAYDLIRARIAKQLVGLKADEVVKRMKSLKQTLAVNAVVVAITVASEDDAFKIFETLNDRGLRLTVPDLLLNHLTRSAEPKDRPTIREKWTYMLEKMGKRDIDRFLRHMWISKFGDVKSRGLYREIKGFITDQKLGPLDFAELCADECDSYVALVDVDDSLGNAGQYVEATVDYLDVPAALPLLLSGVRCLDAGDVERLAKTVVALLVRYLAADLNQATLEETLYKTAREVRQAHARKESSAKTYHTAKTILSGIDALDEQIKISIQKLILNRKQAQFIVTTLANQLQSATKEVAINQGTIEHIFPQKPTNADWPNLDELAPYTWHIGNLTILGAKPNQKAANASFADKRTTHYPKSEIRMTKEVAAKYSKWDVATILTRTNDELLPMLKKAWPKLA
jgi:Protein of unknown function DUF262/Protein of unknown function (DUF1524)